MSEANFEILIIQKPSLGSLEIPNKIWAHFDDYWIHTNRQTLGQTDKQSISIYKLGLSVRLSDWPSVCLFVCIQ